ncbi:MAG: sterol desaturase family protein [Anaerolineae bacterium]|nr:sterol desaturase family protein [Anaerolineae bacterium]
MRLFESDFLEFFTHISPIVIVVTWVPVALLLFIASVLAAPAGAFPWYIPLGIVLGLFLWSFVEYLLHRYLFHYEPTDPRLERIFFLFHGVHHAQPQDKTRLVMPLPVSVPLALLFYGLFYLVFATVLQTPLLVNPVMTGFVVGYLTYDLIHYATHHLPMRSRLGKYLKRHHMIHHYKHPEKRFGVSSPLWDWVFGTFEKQKNS